MHISGKAMNVKDFLGMSLGDVASTFSLPLAVEVPTAMPAVYQMAPSALRVGVCFHLLLSLIIFFSYFL